MDYIVFFCGCCRDGCENFLGCVEFNQVRVQIYFIYIFICLQLEQEVESFRELEVFVQGSLFSFGEQVLVFVFLLVKFFMNNELGDNSCSSDMIDFFMVFFLVLGISEVFDGFIYLGLFGFGFQFGVDDDSLVWILSFSDFDFGGEEEEEEEGSVGNLDNFSCFYLVDIFGISDFGGLVSWIYSYFGCSFILGILDENVNFDVSCFLNGSFEGLREGSFFGNLVLFSMDVGQSSLVDFSLFFCDFFELFQVLLDYSLGFYYVLQKVFDSLDYIEVFYFFLFGFFLFGDVGSCFLEFFMGFFELVVEVLDFFIDSQFEDIVLVFLMEFVLV